MQIGRRHRVHGEGRGFVHPADRVAQRACVARAGNLDRREQLAPALDLVSHQRPGKIETRGRIEQHIVLSETQRAIGARWYDGGCAGAPPDPVEHQANSALGEFRDKPGREPRHTRDHQALDQIKRQRALSLALHAHNNAIAIDIDVGAAMIDMDRSHETSSNIMQRWIERRSWGAQGLDPRARIQQQHQEPILRLDERSEPAPDLPSFAGGEEALVHRQLGVNAEAAHGVERARASPVVGDIIGKQNKIAPGHGLHPGAFSRRQE
jgi:hypothetical protein